MRIAFLGILLASSLMACAADDETTEQEPTTAETKPTTDDLREPTAPGTTKETSGHEPATMPVPPARTNLAAENGAASNAPAE